ncbi:hypothetical protein NPIL_543371 [Nephila pilipes]|uniref:Uncharacterized protein n=1 Tax=Nephila pilipes TaxID=299642 RepID=A0A8X6UC09_NEPPI|nr:hypothetical protein NPIL_543371 [Nephila pilipes]
MQFGTQTACFSMKSVPKAAGGLVKTPCAKEKRANDVSLDETEEGSDYRKRTPLSSGHKSPSVFGNNFTLNHNIRNHVGTARPGKPSQEE